MQNLLKTIQDTLKGDSSLSFLNDSIYIIPEGPDLDLLPNEMALPGLGINDGGESFEYLIRKQKVSIKRVRVSSYVQARRPQWAIVGGDGRKGVIDISSLVIKILEYQLKIKQKEGTNLDDLGYTTSILASSEASTAFGLGPYIAKKAVVFEYRQHI